jgi:YqaJ-like viral recombinase domain
VIPVTAPQGSHGWKRARAGVITASIFKEVSGRSMTDSMHDKAFGFAIERTSTEPLNEGHSGWAAERGHELEPDARIEHQAELSLYVKPVGFCVVDDQWWHGCSADGFIEDDGGAEYKCFIDPKLLRRIVMNNDFSDIEHQAQGCMWVTGRKWWDMGLYCPALRDLGLHWTRRRVERNDDFIESMVDAMEPFRRQVQAYEDELRDRAARRGIVIPSITELRAHLIN